ncbi:endonuclease domain-containing protein [Sphingomonas vulcanisoli]|uniref:endonuclease domain-containing protein n=1 Tax=Sphingomonas vulcanisoli TaxID=1658060 RepID=UPI0014203D4F|nr:endonuclease domain-containing protein [Sphingomonas vulcanisoli]
MRLTGSNNARALAGRLRREMTPPEIALWMALRRNPASLRFRRQHAAGYYILDFYCAPAQLVIEVDGEAHDFGDRPQRDAQRDGWLASQGLMVLRYSASDILTNLDGVLVGIMAVAVERSAESPRYRCPPPPSPSAPPPPGGGGHGA